MVQRGHKGAGLSAETTLGRDQEPGERIRCVSRDFAGWASAPPPGRRQRRNRLGRFNCDGHAYWPFFFNNALLPAGATSRSICRILAMSRFWAGVLAASMIRLAFRVSINSSILAASSGGFLSM